jgi:prepilin-type N-terminal cleavage/methylation domain-containing protein
MRRQKGFTLVELMIVICIIGILASFAALSMTTYRTRGYNMLARSDVKNAFTASQAFFVDDPEGNVTTANLSNYGYTASDNVALTVNNGTLDNLEITSVHGAGDTTYTVNSYGIISPQ